MGSKSYAVGHFALGYLTAKLTGHLTKTKVNVPIVLALSVAPDIDLLLPFMEHRGPSHSILVVIIAFIPIITLFRKKALPYLIALIQHSLLGDFLTGNAQLFWPLTTRLYGTTMDIESLTNIAIEWTTFLAMFIEMLRTKDLQLLFRYNRLNMILTIPTVTVLLPTLLAFPLKVPAALIIPHITLISLFSTSILVNISKAIL